MLIHGRENMEHGSVFVTVDKWVELPEKKPNFSWNNIVNVRIQMIGFGVFLFKTNQNIWVCFAFLIYKINWPNKNKNKTRNNNNKPQT